MYLEPSSHASYGVAVFCVLCCATLVSTTLPSVYTNVILIPCVDSGLIVEWMLA